MNEMDVCWTLFLLTTLGATAVRGNPTITYVQQDNGTVALTCTFEWQTGKHGEKPIHVSWFRRSDTSTQGKPEFLSGEYVGKKSSQNSVTYTRLINHNDVGAVYFCIAQDMNEYGKGPFGNAGMHLEMWVLDAALLTDTTTTPATPSTGCTIPPTSPGNATKLTTGSTTLASTAPDKDIPTTTSTTVPISTTSTLSSKRKTSCPGSVMSDPIVQAVIFTVIFILVAAVIVLTVFIIRMKRKFKGKASKGGRQHGEFDDEYALPVDASKSDDLYRSLGEARRIQAQMNAAFEPEGSNYNDVFGKVGRPAGSDPQGRLEDGYKGDGTTDTPVYQVLDPDAPVYQILDPDAEANEYEEALAANATGATGEGQPPQGGSNLAGVLAKKRGAGTNDYSYVDAKPPHQKAKGSEMAAECSPGNADDGYSHISRTPMPDEQDDVYSHVNRPRVTGSSNTEDAAEGDYSQPYGKAKMAAKGWQGNDGDDYNRLELPSLSNPRPLAAMQKEGKTAATSGTSHPAPGRVAADDENDYEMACDVVQ